MLQSKDQMVPEGECKKQMCCYLYQSTNSLETEQNSDCAVRQKVEDKIMPVFDRMYHVFPATSSTTAFPEFKCKQFLL